MNRYRLLREEKCDGAMFSVERQSGATWTYVSGSLTSDEARARKFFELVSTRPVITVLEERDEVEATTS